VGEVNCFYTYGTFCFSCCEYRGFAIADKTLIISHGIAGYLESIINGNTEVTEVLVNWSLESSASIKYEFLFSKVVFTLEIIMHIL